MREYGTILHGVKLIMNNLKITVVVDNLAAGSCFGEHGLCMFIEYKDKKILFDSGQGFVLNHNLSCLNIEPSDITDFVLSHGHYDHTGGIATLAEMPGFNPNIYLHPMALCAKFANDPDGARYIGISEENSAWLLARKDKLTSSSTPVKISYGITITGQIAEIYPEERCATMFFLNKELTQIDDMNDDQALIFETSKGTVVVLGCCHRGLGNTLEQTTIITGKKEIFAVIGGTHLRNVDKARLDFSVDIIKKYNVKQFIATHCTGFNSAAYLKHALPDIFNMGHTGKILEFDL
jgi:7,8-dihydropterin-6-yl-methyl-4-(beta-D-ribofuranosyl)aminobenzene 5'-phosphate synthase